MVIETKAQADQLIAEVPRLQIAERRIACGTPEPGDLERVPRAGFHVSMEPCVSAAVLAECKDEGRDCPRVELDRRNGEAVALTFLSINNDPLCGGYYEATSAQWAPSERVRVLRRVFGAKADRRVQEILHPKPWPVQKGRA